MIPIKLRLIGVLSLMVMVLLSATSSHAQSSDASQLVTWTCTGSPCTWGSTTSNPAVVWSATLAPTTMRLGYTTSAGVYVPAVRPVGMGIAIAAGTATVYAGLPEASSHRQLASLGQASRM